MCAPITCIAQEPPYLNYGRERAEADVPVQVQVLPAGLIVWGLCELMHLRAPLLYNLSFRTEIALLALFLMFCWI